MAEQSEQLKVIIIVNEQKEETYYDNIVRIDYGVVNIGYVTLFDDQESTTLIDREVLYSITVPKGVGITNTFMQ